MTARSFGDEVRAVIDPVVVPRGFASGQGEGPQIIFCAAFDDVATRFPHLPQATEQPAGVGACVDLVLTADDRMGLATVRLEGMSLEEALRRVGLVGWELEVHDAIPGDRLDALHSLAAALRELLVGPE